MKRILSTLILVAAMLLVSAPNAQAARLINLGAETNSAADEMEQTLNSGTVSISSSTVRSGTYAYRTNPTTGTGFFRAHIFSSNQTSIGYLRAYMRVATRPGSTVQVMRFSSTANAHLASIRLNSDGSVGLYRADNVQVGSNSSVMSLNTWYRLELKLDGNATTNALDARIDGVSFASGNNSSVGSWARILWGPVTPNVTMDAYWDDVVLNDSSGSNQTSFPGEGNLIMLRPDGGGESNQWLDTAGSAGTSSNYTLVDERPPNDGTDLVQSTTNNDTDWYDVGASGVDSYDTVNVVSVSARYRNDTADAAITFRLQIEKTNGGTVTQGSAITPNDTAWRTDQGPVQKPTLVTYADPDGTAWAGGGTLETMRIGPKITVDGTNNIQVSAIWAYVDYTDGAPPAGGRRIMIID